MSPIPFDIKDKIEPQVKDANIELDSYIISNTSYLDVNWKEDIDIKDFNKNHVYFQKDNAEDYIEKILFKKNFNYARKL